MTRTGGCHCGRIRYEVTGEPKTHALCHCTDCRRSAGAPFVAWAMFAADAVRVVNGVVKEYSSSEHGLRYFCAECGTGLFYKNAHVLPGIVDVQSATLDAPESLQPKAHIQVAERIGWMKSAHDLPTFERYPGST